jgi:integrase
MPDNRWRPVLLTAIFTGLRSSELRGLRWTDIDLKGGVLHVRQRADRYSEIGEPKSKAGHRAVPLGPMVLNVLREWKLKCPQSEHKLAFPSLTGGIIRHKDIVHALQKAGRGATLLDSEGKLKYTGLHSLRHFYASWCINPVDRGGQGLPPKVVQERMGHSSIVMTMDTYGHLFPAERDAEKRLADAERALLT